MKIKILMFLLCLSISGNGFAQNQGEVTYQAITPDNADQMTAQFSFECEADTRRASSTFYENIFAYACFDELRGINNYPSITAHSLETGEQLWRIIIDSYINDFELLSSDIVLVELQSRVHVYRIGEAEPIFNEGFANLASLAISPDQEYMALIHGEAGEGNEGQVVIYSLSDFQRLEHEFTISESQYTQIALSNSLIAMADTLGAISVYDIQSGSLVMETSGSQHQVLISGESSGEAVVSQYRIYNELVFTPSSTTLVASECTYKEMGCWATGLTLFDIETGEIAGSLEVPYQSYDFIGFTDDNHLLASEYCNETLNLVTLDTRTITAIPHSVDPQCTQDWASLSKDATLIALYDYDEDESAARYRIFGIPE